MIKIKTVKKSGNCMFLIKGKRSDQINESEVHTINSNSVKGLLNIAVSKSITGVSLLYNVTGLVSLGDYLKTPLNRWGFVNILKNIIATIKAMDVNYFNQKYLVLDFEHVMVNPISHNLYFVYVPIQNADMNFSIRDFLGDIIGKASFEPGEDTSYVGEYIGILQNSVAFSLYEIDKYAERVSNGINGNHVSGGNVEYVRRESGTKEAEPVKEYDALAQAEEINTLNVFTGAQDENKDDTLDSGSVTRVIGTKNKPAAKRAYLVNARTKEKIFITADVFRIGKSRKENDYIVDNDAVSNHHAIIYHENGGYYILDPRSTNGSFIDDEEIEKGVKVELLQGCKLTLADEDFTFFRE